MLKHAKMMMNQAESAFNHAEEILDSTQRNKSNNKIKTQKENEDVIPVDVILKDNKTMLTQAEEELKGKES